MIDFVALGSDSGPAICSIHFIDDAISSSLEERSLSSLPACSVSRPCNRKLHDERSPIVVIGSRTSCLISRMDVSNIPRSVRLFSRTEAIFFVRELVGSGEERLLKMFTMYTGAL